MRLLLPVLTPAALSTALALAGSLSIEPTQLPSATLGHTYSPEPLRVTGGGDCAPNHVRLSVVWGQLPEGLALTGGGYFHGIPTRAGVYAFVVRAWNGCTWTDRGYHLRVEGAPILVVWPEKLEVEVVSGAATLPEQTLRVTATRENMPYWVEEAQVAWLETLPVHGRTAAYGAAMEFDVVRVRFHPGRLPPGVYESRLRVRAWGAVNAPAIPVKLTIRERPAEKPAAGPRVSGWHSGNRRPVSAVRNHGWD